MAMHGPLLLVSPRPPLLRIGSRGGRVSCKEAGKRDYSTAVHMIRVSRQPTAKEAHYSMAMHSCSEAKEILVQLIPLHSIPETSAIMTLYCVTMYQCEKLLKDLRSLESKLLNVKTEMTEL